MASKKESGQKPYRSDPTMSYHDLRKQKTMKATEDESKFRHSDNLKPYNSGNDYSNMENFWPPDPPGPGPFPPWPPYPPAPDPPIPKPTPDPLTEVFRCVGDFCYCPGARRCGSIICTQPIIKFVAPGLTFSIVDNEICVTAPATLTGDVYYTAYMRVTKTINGKQVTWSGKHSDYGGRCDDCDDCNCGGETISYTTQQMAISATQALSVFGANPGCVYTWTTTSGSLSPTSGTSTTFTAPSSNADCAGNATITLNCEGSPVATLKIAINGIPDQLAFTWCENRDCPPCGSFSGYCGSCYKYIACDGRNWIRWLIGGNDSSCDCMGYTSPNEMQAGWQTCAARGMPEGIGDLRTPTMLAQGCCPYQMM